MSNNDLISREALKEALHNEIGNHALSVAIDRVIDNAPTVNDCPNCEYKLEADYIRSSSSYKELIDLRKFKEENTRPQGEWIKITKDGITPAEYTCSNCGRTVKSYYDDYFIVKEYPFCHCGAKMKGGTE